MAGHPAVAECAVVAVQDADKGEVPFGLVVLKDGVNLGEEALRAELVQLVRTKVGPFANFKQAVEVARLPKTRSGKILRQALRQLLDGEKPTIPSTIDDPAVIGELEARLPGCP